MPKTAGSLRSFLLCAGITVALSGCEIVPDREFSALKDTLTLSIVAAERRESGESVDFTFILRNRGSRPALACLGPARSVSYEVASSSGVSFSFVNHPACMREFTIQPGREMTWAETLEVPQLPEGRVQLQIDVQIMNSQRCGGWVKCATFDLKSNEFEIP